MFPEFCQIFEKRIFQTSAMKDFFLRYLGQSPYADVMKTLLKISEFPYMNTSTFTYELVDGACE